MKRLFLLVVLFPVLGFASTVIVVKPPHLHRPNQQQVVIVPGMPRHPLGPSFAKAPHFERHAHHKRGRRHFKKYQAPIYPDRHHHGSHH